MKKWRPDEARQKARQEESQNSNNVTENDVSFAENDVTVTENDINISEHDVTGRASPQGKVEVHLLLIFYSF